MQRLKVLTLALAAVFAISAVAVASASAAPEWFQKGAKIAATKKIGLTAKSKTGQTPTLETTGGTKVTCTSSQTVKGEIEGPRKVVKVVVLYKGCESSGFKCNTAGKGAGEIETKEISGETIYLDSAAKGHTKAGILFKENATSKEFAKFECTAFVKITVKGEVIGEATPLNKEQATGELTFAQEKGVQQWRAIEEKAENKHLEALGEESGIGGGSKLANPLNEEVTFKESVELHKV